MKKFKFIPLFLFLSSALLMVSCQDDTLDIISENDAPTASFNAPSTGQVGEPILFNDSSTDADGTIVSWTWDFGDSETSFDQNPTHTYTTSGTYEVILTVTDDANLTNVMTKRITISDSSENPDPVEAGLINGTMTFDFISRYYALYIPSSYTGDEEVPLVVYLHGGLENKETGSLTTDLVNVSEAEGFILAFAEAIYEPQPESFIWADGRGAVQGAIDGNVDDTGFINALVDLITEDFKINPAKRYLCGFSNGGSLAQHIAFEDNQRFAAIATVSSGVHETYKNANPGRPIPMLFIHGTDDEFASYDEGGISETNLLRFTVGLLNVEESVNFWVTNNQCNTTPTETALEDSDTGDNSTVTTFEYTGGTNGAEVKLYRINGGGHTWPGVLNATLRPQDTFGVNNNDMKAGQEIWNFFERFELN